MLLYKSGAVLIVSCREVLILSLGCCGSVWMFLKKGGLAVEGVLCVKLCDPQMFNCAYMRTV